MFGKSQVVFAITSLGRDRWSAMARLAVACLRATNPNISIVIVCDSDTDRAIRQTADPIKGAADHWIVAVTPAGDPNFRNRYVKTSVRSLLEGPFILLDSDVV